MERNFRTRWDVNNERIIIFEQTNAHLVTNTILFHDPKFNAMIFFIIHVYSKNTDYLKR